MASPANWFLLTQTGRLFTHGPMQPISTTTEKDHDKLVIMFYSGMNDNKRTEKYPEGQQIFRDDIVQTGPVRRVIEFHKGSYGYHDAVGQWLPLCMRKNLDFLKVVGNVHENPELLEEQ